MLLGVFWGAAWKPQPYNDSERVISFRCKVTSEPAKCLCGWVLLDDTSRNVYLWVEEVAHYCVPTQNHVVSLEEQKIPPNKQTNSQRRDKKTNSTQADQTSNTGNVLAEIISPAHDCAHAINGWLFRLMMWAWKRGEPQKSIRYLIRCKPSGEGDIWLVFLVKDNKKQTNSSVICDSSTAHDVSQGKLGNDYYEGKLHPVETRECCLFAATRKYNNSADPLL